MCDLSEIYKFARNPKQAIKTAVLRQLEEISDNPRVSWQAITSAAKRRKEEVLPIALFVLTFKQLGTGIQITDGDMEFAFPELDGVVDFRLFTEVILG